MMEHPEIATEIPWLNEFKSREILSLPRSRPLTLERDSIPLINPVTVMGSQEARLGAGHEVALGEPLDTWVPEARGSSARVFSGTLRDRGGQDKQYAIKVMRPDRVEYALPLFREEAHILALLRDVPGVTPLVECGFLRLEDGSQLPAEDRHLSASHLHGQVVRFGAEQVQNFLSSMDRYMSQNWVPYLALELRDQDQNLLKYCDAGITHGWFLPLRTSLLLSIQICDILQNAHDRNIVYRDHKILHYYWDPASHGVISIDWNIAKRHAEGLTEPERIFDLVQFGARALHHIVTGRPAPGSLPLGPNRPDEIEQASTNYAVNWTYDDERLPNRVKEILEQVLNQGYSQVRDLRSDLAELYDQLPGSA
jgi:serine/threonine protein kinase